jgi:hypothetical protein
VREAAGLVLVRADRRGVFSVTGRGHLRLPATVRVAEVDNPARKVAKPRRLPSTRS